MQNVVNVIHALMLDTTPAICSQIKVSGNHSALESIIKGFHNCLPNFAHTQDANSAIVQD